MSLPNLPYHPRINTRDVIDFRGLDRTDAAAPGSLSDSLNLSTMRYPVLSPRGSREKLDGYSSVDDLYEWDGHLLTVSDGKLYRDGDEICDVTSGKKQWAVVSNRLCVFPDKLIIDLSGDTPDVQSMEADADFSGYASLVMTDSRISAPIFSKTASGRWFPTQWTSGENNQCVYTYGQSKDVVVNSYTGNGWDLDALEDVEIKSGLDFGPSQRGDVQADLHVGDIVLLANDQTWVMADARSASPNPDKSSYGTQGYFAVVTYFRRDTTSSGGVEQYRAYVIYDVYQAKPGAPALYELFAVNDAVSVTGTPEGIADNSSLIVRGVDEAENALLFDDGSFHIVTAYAHLAEPLSTTAQYAWYAGKKYGFTPTEIVEAGVALYMEGDMTLIYLWRDGETVGSYPVTASDAADPPAGAVELQSFVANLTAVHVKRDVPDLDFICESNNRLWGVSNADNTIKVSALGDPRNFSTFDGLATDSYQVAVGSEGDWTGICAYGGGVCCFKERRLHKVLGSYPAEYYTAEYRIDGVAAGCDRSLTVVSERLLYVGVTGIFAYTGGTPSRIGEPLGAAYTDAAGGTDGKRWYLSGKRGGEAEMLVYDLLRGLWIREDDTEAVAFALADGVLHYLDADGDVWQTERGEIDDQTPWVAVFAPIDETWSAGGGRLPVTRKYYIRLDLRLDMAQGSSIKVDVREDGGEWRTALETDTQTDVAKRVTVMPRRCDRFQIRISGTGYVVLRAMTREFLAGSERV